MFYTCRSYVAEWPKYTGIQCKICEEIGRSAWVKTWRVCKSKYHVHGEYDTPDDSLEGDMYPENGIMASTGACNCSSVSSAWRSWASTAAIHIIMKGSSTSGIRRKSAPGIIDSQQRSDWNLVMT